MKQSISFVCPSHKNWGCQADLLFFPIVEVHILTSLVSGVPCMPQFYSTDVPGRPLGQTDPIWNLYEAWWQEVLWRGSTFRHCASQDVMHTRCRGQLSWVDLDKGVIWGGHSQVGCHILNLGKVLFSWSFGACLQRGHVRFTLFWLNLALLARRIFMVISIITSPRSQVP